MLSVFLVEDEQLIRRGLKKLIPWEEYGFVITGEAGDGEEALELITADNTDIVITDIKMPIMDGLELTTLLKERFPAIKIIVLTGFDDYPYMQQSIQNGVFDYLLKPVNAELLTQALFKIKEQIIKSSYSYPFKLEERLINELEGLNIKNVLQTVERIFESFQKYKVPFDISNKICDNILASINRYLDHFGCNINDILRKDGADGNYFCKCHTKIELKNQMIEILESVVEYKSKRGNRKIVDQIKDYIQKNLHEDITLDIIAAKFYLNSSYLSQMFKSEAGENYVDFLMKLRIERAKKLLNDKSLRIQDICDIVGYKDSKYFGQLFKKQVGMLPSEYRAMN